jgi:mono/diheme cytochrome c family protein
MRKFLWMAAFLMPLGLFAQNSMYWPDPNWKAPEGAVAQTNPLASRPDLAAGGRKLFMRNCAECHAKDGAGKAKKHSANLQIPAVQMQSDGTLFWKITNGNTGKGMPSFSKLPEPERWQIVMYLRGLNQNAP